MIKTYLADFPAPLLAFMRLGLALLVFLPWMQWRLKNPRHYRFFLGLGAIQYGLMYTLLFSAFRYLQAHELIVFTLLTPVYVTLLGEIHAREGVHLRFWGAALLAIAGAMVIRFRGLESGDWWIGFLILQGANFCFAFGQVRYRIFKRNNPDIQDHRIFGWIFLGGTALAGLYAAAEGRSAPAWSGESVSVVLYLGMVATAGGFFLWNRGAALVKNTAVLAAFNNVSIPLGVLAAVFVFGEEADWLRLLGGGSLIAVAVLLAMWGPQSR